MSLDEALLEECADITLRCDDADLPCCKYQVMRTCPVVRHVIEDIGIQPDPTSGRAVFPFPGVDAASLRAAMAVIHYAKPGELNLDEITAAMRGMDLLGCTVHDAALTDRVWAIVRCEPSLETIRPHLQRLLEYEPTRVPAIRALVQAAPLWKDAHHAIAHLDMDIHLARTLVKYLGKIYPPNLVYRGIVALMPFTGLTLDAIMELFATTHLGAFLHPEESLEILSYMKTMIDVRGWHGREASLVQTMCLALRTYDTSPSTLGRIHGSVVLFDDNPSASIYVMMESRKTVLMRRIAPWFKVSIDRFSGTHDFEFQLGRLDDDLAKRASRADLRIVASARRALGGTVMRYSEMWYHFSGISPWLRVMPGATTCTRGDIDEFMETIRSGHSLSLRIDIFYGAASVLELPPV